MNDSLTDEMKILLRNKSLFTFQEIDRAQKKIDIQKIQRSNRLNYRFRRLSQLEIEFIKNEMDLVFEVSHVVCHLGYKNKLRKMPISLMKLDQNVVAKITGIPRNDAETEARDGMLSLLYMDGLSQLSYLKVHEDFPFSNKHFFMRMMNLMCMGAKK